MNMGYINNKSKSTSAFLQDRYGITIDELKALYTKQEGKCAMCGEEKKLSIDHAHGTRTVRGLLCSKCNSALVYLENPVFIEQAQKYLNKQLTTPTKSRRTT